MTMKRKATTNSWAFLGGLVVGSALMTAALAFAEKDDTPKNHIGLAPGASIDAINQKLASMTNIVPFQIRAVYKAGPDGNGKVAQQTVTADVYDCLNKQVKELRQIAERLGKTSAELSTAFASKGGIPQLDFYDHTGAAAGNKDLKGGDHLTIPGARELGVPSVSRTLLEISFAKKKDEPAGALGCREKKNKKDDALAHQFANLLGMKVIAQPAGGAGDGSGGKKKKDSPAGSGSGSGE